MKKQMNLGFLIEILERKDREAVVLFDFVYFRPTTVHSYRGFYEQLAIGYSSEGEIKVAELLKILKDAVGKTFTGYKGGDYVMADDTPVWVANHGEAGGTAVVDVYDLGWCMMIETEHHDF